MPPLFVVNSTSGEFEELTRYVFSNQVVSRIESMGYVPGITFKPYIRGVAWDGDAFWFVDWDNNILMKVRIDGVVLASYAEDASHTWGLLGDITYDGTDILLINDNAIVAVDVDDGSVSSTSYGTPTGMLDLWGLAHDGDGLFVSYRHSDNTARVARHDGSSWSAGKQVTVTNTPFTMDWESDHLWICDRDDVQAIQMDWDTWTQVWEISLTDLGNNPVGITFGPESQVSPPPVRLIQRDDGMHAT